MTDEISDLCLFTRVVAASRKRHGGPSAHFESDQVKLYVTYATRTHLPPRVRLFIDFVVSALQKI